MLLTSTRASWPHPSLFRIEFLVIFRDFVTFFDPAQNAELVWEGHVTFMRVLGNVGDPHEGSWKSPALTQTLLKESDLPNYIPQGKVQVHSADLWKASEKGRGCLQNSWKNPAHPRDFCHNLPKGRTQYIMQTFTKVTGRVNYLCKVPGKAAVLPQTF